MKRIFCLLIVTSFISNALHAQIYVRGNVVDASSGAKLSDVFVRDITNKQITLTDKSGKFEIKSETGHTLIFSSPNYVPDTLYVIDLAQKHIELRAKTISLREVNITAQRLSFDPHKEY